MAHLAAKGKLSAGDTFVHESYIHSRFIGRIESETELGWSQGHIPSIEGSAIVTGHNTLWIDEQDEFAAGFLVE
jgi:4-hydroxyproline epimerase